jgi:N utilization substance protein A
MGSELLRIVDTIHREKNIDKEIVFQGLEQALAAAAKKRLENPDDVVVTIDRQTGEIAAREGERAIDPAELGRIAALTAKQVMIQKFREAERDVIFDEYEKKKGEMVTGVVQRYEKPNVIINLGKAEGLLPGREQPPGETYHVGERLKTLIVDVKKVGQKVRIICSRTHPDIVKALFEMEVPEIQDKVIEIRAIARDPGYRTKVAVASLDAKVDAVGACVGIRGSRIKNIVDELNGEKIDIVRFNESPEVFIMNSLKPAEIQGIELDFETRRALVFVAEEQLSLAIGKRGQNVRLASRITGWDIDIVTGTPDNYVEKFVTSRPLEEIQAERARAAAAAAAALEGKVAVSAEAAPAAEGAPAGAAGEGEAVGAAAAPALAPKAPAFSKPDLFAKIAASAPPAERKPVSSGAAALEALLSKNAPAAPAPWLAERKKPDKEGGNASIDAGAVGPGTDGEASAEKGRDSAAAPEEKPQGE